MNHDLAAAVRQQQVALLAEEIASSLDAAVVPPALLDAAAGPSDADFTPSCTPRLTVPEASSSDGGDDLPARVARWLRQDGMSEAVMGAVAEALTTGLSRRRVAGDVVRSDAEQLKLLEHGTSVRALLRQGGLVDRLSSAMHNATHRAAGETTPTASQLLPQAVSLPPPMVEQLAASAESLAAVLRAEQQIARLEAGIADTPQKGGGGAAALPEPTPPPPTSTAPQRTSASPAAKREATQKPSAREGTQRQGTRARSGAAGGGVRGPVRRILSALSLGRGKRRGHMDPKPDPKPWVEPADLFDEATPRLDESAAPIPASTSWPPRAAPPPLAAPSNAVVDVSDAVASEPSGGPMPPLYEVPIAAYRLSVSDALDIFNIQGASTVTLLGAIVSLPRPWADRVGEIADACITCLKLSGMSDGLERKALEANVRAHMIAAEEALVAATAADGGARPGALELANIVLARAESWQFDSSGRVDVAPMLPADAVAEALMSVPQLAAHALRHMAFAHLPLGHLRFEQVAAYRYSLFARAPSASPPCAIITVGPPGCGKSYLLQTRRHSSELSSLPPLESFANIDPDETVHFVCGGKGKAVDPSVRPYANFVNHENFLAAVAQRRHLIFDGSGRDPLNICGRVISRLVPKGYRVCILVVLCSHGTCVRRADERAAVTGRATARSFIDMVFKSLQRAVPIYLRQQASIAERVLVYTNEEQPELAVELRPHMPHLVPRAVELANRLLALPSDQAEAGADLNA